MTTLRFQSSCNRFVLILPKQVVEKIQAQAKRDWPMETGGMLVGSYTQSQNSALVTDAFDTADKLEGFTFTSCDPNRMQEFLDELWEQSKGEEYYLGEWHSHPNNAPNPSGLDNETMLSIAKEEGVSCPEPVMVIVGYNALPEFFRAFVYPGVCIPMEQVST